MANRSFDASTAGSFSRLLSKKHEEDRASLGRTRTASKPASVAGDVVDAVFDHERQSLLHCLSDTNRSMAKLASERDKLIDRLERVQAESTKEHVVMKSKLETAQMEVGALRQQLREKTLECELLQTSMFQAQNELSDAGKSTTLRISELENQVREYKTRSEDYEREIEEYRRRLLSKSQDVQAREQELLKEKEVAEARIIRLTQQLDQSQRRVKHNKEARDLEDQLKVALAHVEALKQTVHAQSLELTELRTEVGTARTSTSASHVRQLQKELSQLRMQLQAAQSVKPLSSMSRLSGGGGDDVVARLSAENERLRSELRDCQSDLTFLQEAGDAEIARQVAKARAEWSIATQESQHHHEQAQQQQQQLLQRSTASDAQDAMTASLTRERDELKQALTELQSAHMEVQNVVISYHEDFESLHKEYQSVTQALSSRVAECDEAKSNVTRLEAQLRMIESLQTDKEKGLTHEVTSLKSELRQKDCELEQTFNLAGDLNKQREELVKLVQDLTLSEERHCATVAQLSDAVAKLRIEHEAVKVERESLLRERKEHLEIIQEMAAQRKLQAALLEQLSGRMQSGVLPESSSGRSNPRRYSEPVRSRSNGPRAARMSHATTISNVGEDGEEGGGREVDQSSMDDGTMSGTLHPMIVGIQYGPGSPKTPRGMPLGKLKRSPSPATRSIRSGGSNDHNPTEDGYPMLARAKAVIRRCQAVADHNTTAVTEPDGVDQGDNTST